MPSSSLVEIEVEIGVRVDVGVGGWVNTDLI